MFKRTIPLVTAILLTIAPAVQSENLFSEGRAKPNSFWWPELLDLEPLRSHDARSNPYGNDFDYAVAFASVDLKALKADIEKALDSGQLQHRIAANVPLDEIARANELVESGSIRGCVVLELD